MKYIRAETGIVIFSNHIAHADVANKLRDVLGEPTSAGSISMSGETLVDCHGLSHTLKVDASPFDERAIKTALGLS